MTQSLVPIQDATLPDELPERHLVALDRIQMETAHGQMLTWVAAKLKEVAREIHDNSHNLNVARERKWAMKPFQSRVALLQRRKLFYEKIGAALNQGFVIVPNFSMDAFAIRTKAKTPRGNILNGRWNTFVQPTQLLAQGEGRYCSPRPTVETATDEVVREGKTVNITSQWPVDFKDVDFPMALARPEIMTRAGEVLALKLFDEVGMADGVSGGNRRRTGDPILLGRLLNPRRFAQPVTFFLGWYFDPSAL